VVSLSPVDLRKLRTNCEEAKLTHLHWRTNSRVGEWSRIHGAAALYEIPYWMRRAQNQ